MEGVVQKISLISAQLFWRRKKGSEQKSFQLFVPLESEL